MSVGLTPHVVEVEVDISRGMKSFAIVGLPDKAVEEAKDRINAAIKNSGYEAPQKGNRKTIVSLAPADLKKEGPLFDLSIALAHLLATGELKFNPKEKLFLGELALSGEVRPIKGTLALTRLAEQSGFKEIYVPSPNATEAALVEGIDVYAIDDLRQVVEHLQEHPPNKDAKSVVKQVSQVNKGQKGQKDAPTSSEQAAKLKPVQKTIIKFHSDQPLVNFSEVRGQESAKRGLIIAAAGRHNLAMSGPPGTGKTMLAKAFTGILPSLSREEILETTAIHSVAGTLFDKQNQADFLTSPPLRSPHHTSSYVALVGGGTVPRPGEITLAHNGVLFLDEFPEFEKRVIESLRQPLEDKIITVSRAKGTSRFPANFILIATMNPCPCGNAGIVGKSCTCSQASLMSYQRKISGPIIDRIDMWAEVPQIEYSKLSSATCGEDTSTIRAKVEKARDIQTQRFKKTKLRTNADMAVKDLARYAILDSACTSLLNSAAKKHDLSARAYHRIQRLARTIADLAHCENIKEEHLLEALSYRPKRQTL